MLPQSPRFALLLARISASSITSASNGIPIRRVCRLTARSRSFSSSTQLHSTLLDELPEWATIRETVRPSAMWLAPKGSKFDQQQVIDQLPKLGGQGEELPVVLLLVTPKLSHLFENDHPFHSHVINTIYGNFPQGTLRQSIVAVVDALPLVGSLRGARKPEMDGTEGIALCISPGFDVSPATNKQNTQPLISMTARNPFFDGRRYVTVSYSGGVANTTFVNGRQHTLFMQNWWNREGSRWLPETKRQTLSRVDVTTYANRNGNYLSMVWYSKMIKLTDPKVILSSMGNIVRQLETSDGEELAASHELETIVPKMLKELQKTTPTGDLRVFALVYPPQIGGKDAFKDYVWKKEPKTKALQLRQYNMNLLTLLTRGARLYRVTSGGAGWGKKAGLLSLEPITELGGSAIEPDFPSFIFEQAQDIRMPGSADLFPPGHIIQFIGSFHDTEGLKKDAFTTDKVKSFASDPTESPTDWMDEGKGQQFCLGNTVLPETHQYTSLDNVDNSPATANTPTKSTLQSLIFQPNRFGFLTSSALGFSAEHHSTSQMTEVWRKRQKSTWVDPETDAGYKHSTLIELPNSYFLTRFAAGGRVVAEAAENFTGSGDSKESRDINRLTPVEHELTTDESVAFASRRLRDAERIQKDSYLARSRGKVRKVVTGSESVTLNVPSERPSLISKYESELKHMAMIQDMATTVLGIDELVEGRVKEYEEFQGSLRKSKRRLRRYITYRSTLLAEGQFSRLGVISDTTSKAPFRYTISDTIPKAPIRYTTSEPLQEKFVETQISSEQEYWVRLVQAGPDDPIGFEPYCYGPPEPISPVRRTISTPRSLRHDYSSLVHKSSIFRTYSSADSETEENEDKVKSEKDRKAIEALITNL